MSLEYADNISGRVGKLVTPADCKSVATSTAGSSPAAPTNFWGCNSDGRVAD